MTEVPSCLLKRLLSLVICWCMSGCSLVGHGSINRTASPNDNPPNPTTTAVQASTPVLATEPTSAPGATTINTPIATSTEPALQLALVGPQPSRSSTAYFQETPPNMVYLSDLEPDGERWLSFSLSDHTTTVVPLPRSTQSLTEDVWNRINGVPDWSRARDMISWSMLSPSGDKLAYVRQESSTSVATTIAVYSFATDSTVDLGLAPTDCQHNPAPVSSWTSSEDKFVFFCGLPSAVFVADLEAQTYRLSDSIITDGPSGFALSPNGEKFAYIDPDGQVRLLDLDNLTSRVVSDSGTGLAWSADSKQLYYIKSKVDKWCFAGDIYVLDIDTGSESLVVISPIQLPTGEQVEIYCSAPLAVAKNGLAVAFSGTDGFWILLLP